MKKMYAFLIIAAAMTTPSCNDSKKSETAETAKKPDTAETEKKPETSEKPETACDCVGKMNQVLKDLNKLTVKEIATIGPDMGAYMDKKLYEGNDCKKIMEKADEIYPTPESMEKDCPQVKELISLQKEFVNMMGGSQNSSQPEAEMPEDF